MPGWQIQLLFFLFYPNVCPFIPCWSSKQCSYVYYTPHTSMFFRFHIRFHMRRKKNRRKNIIILHPPWIFSATPWFVCPAQNIPLVFPTDRQGFPWPFPYQTFRHTTTVAVIQVLRRTLINITIAFYKISASQFFYIVFGQRVKQIYVDYIKLTTS